MDDTAALSQAVDAFTGVLLGKDDSLLERAWAWGPYEGEGVRFAHFRTFEELRELEVNIRARRNAAGRAPTSAQSILTQYHRAWREMQAALRWISAADAVRRPAPGEWSLQQTLAHMAGAEIGFYVAIRHALEHRRSGHIDTTKPTSEVWDALSGLTQSAANATLEGSYAQLLEFTDMWHTKVLNGFADIYDAELETLSLFWEDRPFSIRFRLHRYESHLRQHAIQMDKTLGAIGCAPGETQRLHLLIYGALGDVEGALLGAHDIAVAECATAAETINARAVTTQAAIAA
jgi:hypothetical protein